MTLPRGGKWTIRPNVANGGLAGALVIPIVEPAPTQVIHVLHMVRKASGEVIGVVLGKLGEGARSGAADTADAVGHRPPSRSATRSSRKALGSAA